MNQLTLIEIEYNNWNGFIFDFIHLELQSGFEGSLFGIYASYDHFILGLLFFSFEIKSPL